jgi:hypothetical protein
MDSIRLKATPVQCFGLRNGRIEIDTVFGGTSPFYYSIDGQSFSTNPVFDRLWSGEYQITVRDAAGCVKTWPLAVTEPELLVVRLLASDTHVVAGKPIQIRAEYSPDTAPIGKIDWRPPFVFQRQDTLAQTFSLSQTTEIAIEIVDLNGCLARDQITIQVDETNIFFPNAIQPGSNQNAWFTGFADDGVKEISALQIFSRNGSLIFERRHFAPNTPLLGWGGRWQGKYVQSGVYLWIAEVEYLDGRKSKQKGTISVVY